MPRSQQPRRNETRGSDHQRIQHDPGPVTSSVQASHSLTQRANSPIQLVPAWSHRLPSEIRTGDALPNFVVTLRVVGDDIQGQPSPIEPGGSISAMATIVTAEGHFVSNPGDLIVMHPMTATAPERHFVIREDTQWTFNFIPGVAGTGINVSGYYRIQVVLIDNPTIIRPDGVAEVDSPLRIGITRSQVIHVHTFAPRFPV